MERVAGPDLMLAIMSDPRFRGRTHFLCGGKEGVAEELRQVLQRRYPWIRILGVHVPPFGILSNEHEKELKDKVNAIRPDIVWVGISTPKQERFMHRYLPQLETKLMFGVGAALIFIQAESLIARIG